MAKKKYSECALLTIVIIAILVYAIVRIYLFVSLAYSPLDYIFSLLLITGESLILLHSFGYVAGMLRVIIEKGRAPEKPGLPPRLMGEEPSVAVLVAARHEPKDILEKTFTTICAMSYKNKTAYFLDDSSEEKFKSEARDLCRQHGLKLFTRAQRHGAKAGIINDCLKTLREKYVVIFDADVNPLPEFLSVTIPIMENDKRLGFIQTPQFYSNIEDNLVARGAAFQQAVFYEYICEAKGTQGAMFCCGTNVVIRREALAQVGGFDESSVTEDFATSIKLHAAGWTSLYYEHVYAFGMAPQDLAGYFKQQFRWATGTLSVFRKIIWQFLTKPFSLRPMQWWEYFLSSTFYLIGIAFLFLMICPVVYLFFHVPSSFAKPEIYFMAFIPYFVFTLLIFYAMLIKRKYKLKDMILGQLLGIFTFSVYVRAAITSILGIKTGFGVTGKGQMKSIAYIRLWPQILMVVSNLIAIIWGLNEYFYSRETSVLVCCLWGSFSVATLGAGFYFNEKYK